MAKERNSETINQTRTDKLKAVRDLWLWCDGHRDCDDCCFAEAAHLCNISDIHDHYFVNEVNESMKPKEEKKNDD